MITIKKIYVDNESTADLNSSLKVIYSRKSSQICKKNEDFIELEDVNLGKLEKEFIKQIKI
jgi:hypothetical protein